MLKSLELFGFKSFADRTKIEFSSGITAVVGPNGSGKSNVVDGIKWILGDQSPKSLRGKEMTDVIFNGARNRKAAGLAEATLVFDNSSGFLPIEAAEVHVGRRLWRSGDSEYLLNNSPVRLKDIRQLLMGTGAGSAAYSIIEQGRVDQILQANAISRRSIFEESAGISLYRSRRAEFIRRMERVDQILVRLTDIVDEVEAQRNALRSQAERAVIYRELSEELRTRWLGLAADDYRALQDRIQESSERTAERKNTLQQCDADRREVESRLAQVDQKLGEVDRRLRGKDREVSSLRETVAGHLTTIRLQAGRMSELDSDFLRLKRQRAHLEDRVREGEREHEHLLEALQGSEQSCRELEESVEEHQTDIASLEQQLRNDSESAQKQHADVEQNKQQQATLQAELQSLRTQSITACSAADAAGERFTELDERLMAQQRLCEEAELRSEEAEAALQMAQQEQQDVSNRRRALLDELSAHQTSLGEMRERRSGCHARITVLDDLEKRQEGFGIGVREILRRAETSDYSPWNRIAGTVADLLDVDLEDAALLEAALGNRSQLIVIREFEPLVEYLLAHSAQISGRVGFLELDSSRIDHAEGTQPPAGGARQLSFQFGDSAGTEPYVFNRPPTDTHDRYELSGRPGVVRRADELVALAGEFTQLPARILADTWIVETLETAFRLADETGGRCRFVTLQGELLECDGTLTVGAPRGESAVVSRKSELRQLKNELLRLDDRLEREEHELAATNEQLAQADDGLAAADERAQRAANELSERKSDFAAGNREFERLTVESESLRTEIAGLKDVADNFDREQAERQSLLEQTQQDLQALQEAVEFTQSRLTANEDRLQAAHKICDADQLQFAKQQERRQAMMEAFERASRDHEDREQQRDESLRRLIAMRTRRRDTELAVLKTRSDLAELSLTLEQRIAETETVVAEKDEIRGRRVELTHRETDLRKKSQALQDGIHADEMTVRESRQRQESLSERIREEYQIELADIVASDVSAITDYLAEQYDDAHEDDLAGEITFEDVRDKLESQVERLRRKLKTIGSVNADSLRDLDEIEGRYENLSTTLNDLVEAKKHLEDLVRRIDQKCKQLFRETFDAIRVNFQELFRKAFGGGDGDIILEDPDDVLECGIDIVARPPGKELKSISLLSGGEKTLTAFALLLAMFRHRPSPYCVLDEVDAALDEANVERLRALLTEFRDSTQFVIITHKKPTMAIADLLYGVTMEESGVSKRLTVKFENVGENGEFLTDENQPAAA